mmetsp:Transcript_18892/g.37410  ORF Transcript_18892/g.37410 Transcript_18892/m.37410 type:complete len:98 (-) Transcript_18892:558-851(-)
MVAEEVSCGQKRVGRVVSKLFASRLLPQVQGRAFECSSGPAIPKETNHHHSTFRFQTKHLNHCRLLPLPSFLFVKAVAMNQYKAGQLAASRRVDICT